MKKTFYNLNFKISRINYLLVLFEIFSLLKFIFLELKIKLKIIVLEFFCMFLFLIFFTTLNSEVLSRI